MAFFAACQRDLGVSDPSDEEIKVYPAMVFLRLYEEVADHLYYAKMALIGSNIQEAHEILDTVISDIHSGAIATNHADPVVARAREKLFKEWNADV